MGESYKQDTKLAFIVKVKDDHSELSSRSIEVSLYLVWKRANKKHTNLCDTDIHIKMTLFLWHRAFLYDAGQQTSGEGNSKNAIKSKCVENMK